MTIHISKVHDDWVNKGCHLHVGPVELVLRPDHCGGIVMKGVFRSTSTKDLDAAIRVVKDWLKELTNRQTLFWDVQRALGYLHGVRGLLMDLAKGRQAELAFLLSALRKMGI